MSKAKEPRKQLQRNNSIRRALLRPLLPITISRASQRAEKMYIKNSWTCFAKSLKVIHEDLTPI